MASKLAAYVCAFCQPLGDIVFLTLKAGGSLEPCFSSGRDGQNKYAPKPESIQPPQAVSLLSVDHQLVGILRPSVAL